MDFGAFAHLRRHGCIGNSALREISVFVCDGETHACQPSGGASVTILMAEDDPGSRDLLREMLTSWGHYVIDCDNGAEALTKLLVFDVDLVILDVQMPN